LEPKSGAFLVAGFLLAEPHMIRRFGFPFALCLFAVACSSSSSSKGGPGVGNVGNSATDIVDDTTWKDGTKLSASVTIEAGVTVTIDPGAKITCPSGGAITVFGTLKHAANSTHASFSCDKWTGIVVGQGATLDLDSVDIANASNGLEIQGGNAAATWDNGVMSGCETPFLMGVGSTLTTTHSKITSVTGYSQIKGALTASYLEYDAGTNEGIVLGDPSASLDVTDSTFTGALGGGTDSDFVVSEQGKSIKVAYTKITGAHCGFHIDSVAQFTIDHVTSDNVYGAMLYGSGSGPNTISYSNFTGKADALDVQGTNGEIDISNSYVGSNDNYAGSMPKITSPASGMVTGAGPR
jgi:hypothetical protein